METHLQQALGQLKLKLMSMFAMSEKAMNNAVQALLQRDEELAQMVIDEDEAVNQLEVEIDDTCLRLLAREQPVAMDLRFILGCSRIAVDLERIADQAVNIAERALMLSHRPPIPFNQSLEELAEKTMEMFTKAIDTFLNRDMDSAIAVCSMDSEVDERYIRLIKSLIDYLGSEKSMVERPVHTIMVSKCLERVADLATNIAETVVFIEKGVDIRHACEMDQLKLIG